MKLGSKVRMWALPLHRTRVLPLRKGTRVLPLPRVQRMRVLPLCAEVTRVLPLTLAPQ